MLEQWKVEIEQKTYGQLTVFVFHGAANIKGMNKKRLKKYDVVLTSESTHNGMSFKLIQLF